MNKDYILDKLDDYSEEIDLKKVQKALDFVDEAELSKISRLIELLLPLSPDEDSVIALILSAGVEINDIQEKFGAMVANIVGSLRKLDSLNYAENDRASQLEVLRKMFLVVAKDIRVVILGLVCRLYMLENIDEDFDEERLKLCASETLDLYVPIASRLGIYRLKSELEDLAFKFSNPSEYNRIDKQLRNLRKNCELSINLITKELKEFFEGRGVKAKVYGRIKGIYSIYKKLSRKNLSSVSDLYDIFAMRVILSEDSAVDGLYSVLGMIHSEWRPISKRFKDYIAVPKPNGYRSLHTVVLGLAPKDMDQPVEIQIRDERMHQDAEYGVSSHWLYKKHKGLVDKEALRSQVDWLLGLEKLRDENDMEIDVFKDRIFVLTPRGEVKDLPFGACPIDFAYSVHTDIGNRCYMAKVDGKVVSLDSALKNGQVVEIMTRKDITPKIQWLSFVKSNLSKNRIKAWFNAQNRENNIKEGRDLLNARLERLGKPLLDQNYSILKDFCGQDLTLSQRESLVEEVGKGGKLVSDVVRKVYPYEEVVDKVVVPEISERDHGDLTHKVLENEVLIGGESGLPVKIGACCKPKIKDDIVGYVTRGQSITVHVSKCSFLSGLNPERLIFAEWKGRSGESHSKALYHVGIKVKVYTRIGIINDITTVISALGVSIRDVEIRRAKSGFYEDYFLLEFDDLNKFDVLMDQLEKVDGVVSVKREDKVKTLKVN